MSLAVATQYAKALLEIVTAPGSALDAEQALAQVDAFLEIVGGSHELRDALVTPAISQAQKRAAVGKVCELAGIGPLVRNFMFVVIHKRRLGLLAEIREMFRAQLDERLGIVRPAVTSSVPLAEQARAALESKLAARTAKQVRCTYAVDKELLGGASVKVGSLVLDGSVRGRLDALGRQLLAGA